MGVVWLVLWRLCAEGECCRWMCCGVGGRGRGVCGGSVVGGRGTIWVEGSGGL